MGGEREVRGRREGVRGKREGVKEGQGGILRGRRSERKKSVAWRRGRSFGWDGG